MKNVGYFFNSEQDGQSIFAQWDSLEHCDTSMVTGNALGVPLNSGGFCGTCAEGPLTPPHKAHVDFRPLSPHHRPSQDPGVREPVLARY
jgi:hypothetical protein